MIGAVTVWIGICLLIFEQPLFGAILFAIGLFLWLHYKEKPTQTNQQTTAN